MSCRFRCRTGTAYNPIGLVAMKQKGLNIVTPRRERWLKNPIGNRLEGLNPLPSLVAVHLFQMIEVMVDPDRFIISTGTIYNDPTVLRGAVEKVCEVRQIWKIRGRIDHEYSEIERPDIQ